jgi:hypothetical protein
LPPIEPKKPPLQVNIPPAYPVLVPNSEGKIDPKDIESGFILGGQAYNACVIELASVVKQAEACINDPK